MPSSYSPLKIQLMETGENSGTWGEITNVNLGVALEEAVVGSAEILFSGSDVVLTLSNTNTTQPARHLRLKLTGSSGGARTLTVPAIEKNYLISNTLADQVEVRNASGTGVIVPAGRAMYVYNDGTNVVEASNHMSSLTLTTALQPSSGGTGATTLAGARSNILPAYAGNATKALVVNSGATDVEYQFVGNVFTTAFQDVSNKTLLGTQEKVTISVSAASSTVTLDALTSSVLYYQGNATGNWTLNVRGDGSNTLNSIMDIGDAITVAFLNTNGGSAYRQTGFTIDGNAVTPKWQGGSAPGTGNANSIDSYIATIIKTGSGSFVVLEAQTRFA
jgi:hypothetical protein